MKQVSLITSPKDASIQALDVLQQGGVIVFPTDTVYGIGGDALAASVHKRIAAYKKRDVDKPFPWLVATTEMAKRYGVFSPTIERLVESSWPGATTIILPAVGRDASVGLRVPRHDWLQGLIAQFHGPIIGTSANRSGDAPATEAESAAEMFPEADLLIDGGVCSGAPSQVIDATTNTFRTLRT